MDEPFEGSMGKGSAAHKRSRDAGGQSLRDSAHSSARNPPGFHVYCRQYIWIDSLRIHWSRRIYLRTQIRRSEAAHHRCSLDDLSLLRFRDLAALCDWGALNGIAFPLSQLGELSDRRGGV